MLRSQAWRAAAAAALLGTGAHAAESVTGRVGNGHGARGYELRVPSGHDARQPLPLLVALHGCLQTPAQLAGVARLDRLADEKRILVLYPEQSVAANPARCWNWFNPSDQQRGSGEPALIASMIDEVRSKHAVDAARIYVAGISAGGMLSGTLLACYPDVFAAGAIVAGGMYRAANGLAEGMSVMRSGSAYDPQVRGEEAWKCGGSLAPRPVPVLVVHGDADSVVAPVNADQAVAQFLRTNDFADDGSANGSVGGKLADG
ncbi:MAG TPA: PHB depolymerase family esterase, partial [Steroidobacteraceae bacterium]|nr:PHB depolymerase family esterase [Steroidobacteraceae bacterium]